MVFRDGYVAFSERRERALTVEPGGRDKAVDGAADDVLEQQPAFDDSRARLVAREAQEFAFARRHEPRANPVGAPHVPSLIPMEEAVKEDFRPGFGPAAQARGEGRAGNNWRIAPMVRNDEHRHAIADMRAEHVEQPVDLAFEARRYVVDRRKQESGGGGGHWRAFALAVRGVLAH